MKLSILKVGIAGTPPVNHAYAYLWQSNAAQAPQSSLPVMLKREKKIRLITQSALPTLEPIQQQPDLLQHCGFVVTTRWDGRFPTMFDAQSKVIPFTDIPPGSVALSVVAHVAESCVPMLMKMQGPALTMSSTRGLVAAIQVAAALLLTNRAPVMLVQEFEMALPVNLQEQGLQPQQDYAISLLLAQESWGQPIIGELTL